MNNSANLMQPPPDTPKYKGYRARRLCVSFLEIAAQQISDRGSKRLMSFTGVLNGTLIRLRGSTHIENAFPSLETSLWDGIKRTHAALKVPLGSIGAVERALEETLPNLQTDIDDLVLLLKMRLCLEKTYDVACNQNDTGAINTTVGALFKGLMQDCGIKTTSRTSYEKLSNAVKDIFKLP